MKSARNDSTEPDSSNTPATAPKISTSSFPWAKAVIKSANSVLKPPQYTAAALASVQAFNFRPNAKPASR